MKPDVTLSFNGGYLKPLKLEDAHQGYVDGLNDSDVHRHLDSVRQSVQTEKSIADFIQYNLDSNNAVLFGIWLTGSTRHCGTIRLHGIEHFHHTAHIGICIFDKNAWGKGLGSKAIRVTSDWAVEYFRLRWLEAGAYAQNIASQKAFISANYEWMYDIPEKYLFEGKPALVKVYAYRNKEFIDTAS